MSITGLGHFTIKCTTEKLLPLRAFYGELLGLKEGARPDFPFPGTWLYRGDKPIVHLYASEAVDRDDQTAALDHIAFDAEEIDAVRTKLSAGGIPYFERPVTGYALHQLFLQDPAGIKLEMTFATPSVAQGEDQRLSINGTRLAFEVEGSGQPLLLLHGGAGNRRMFDQLVPYLSETYRVIRFDQRDCGDSEASPRPYDFDVLADDAVAVLRALDVPKAHVFGTSFGGLLAQAVALRHPRCVDKLVLSSTWRLGIPLVQMNPGITSILGGERTPENLARVFFSENFLNLHADAADFFRRSAPGMSGTRAALLRQERMIRPGSIDTPTLVIGGEDDRIVPFDQSRRLKESIGHALIADPLSGVGHVSAVEAPQKVADLVRTFC
jgi:pimeloyl-ACP methyl ester carboxylesterase/catechol 2,3-dioxygenase-like lactoylglutathione lyase family enzyme